MYEDNRENEYIAIIGDIIDSRNLENRDEVQRQLKKLLDLINEEYDDDIAAKFLITLGDEFQGLLHSHENIINILNKIEAYMYPVKIRFGIGIGTVNTGIDYNKSNEIDGEAYHIARRMIENVEKNMNGYGESSSNVMIDFSGNRTVKSELINAIFSLRYVVKSKWTKRQSELISVYEMNKCNQKKTAECLSISQSTVSRTLKKANYFSIRMADDVLKKYLNGGE